MYLPDSAMSALPFDLDSVLDTLADKGWVVIPHALPAELVQQLRDTCLAVWDAGRFHEAATGRAAGQARRAEIRSDSVLWLDQVADAPAVQAYNAAMDDIMHAVNRGLYLGLAELESHFAVYPTGAFYKKHLDRFRDDDARVLSSVLYLNADWSEDDGGALRLHLPAGCHDIAPRAGTLALFLSAEIEHEVLPAARERLSIAGWFRRRDVP